MKYIFIATLLLVSILASAETPKSSAAEELMRIMRYDRIMLGAFFYPHTEERLRNKDVEEGADAKMFYSCLERSESAVIIKALAAELEKHISRKDMAMTLDFYKSPTGHKVLEGYAVLANNPLGPWPEASRPDFSNAETVELIEFENSAAYKAFELFSSGLGKKRQVVKVIMLEAQKIERACANLAQGSQ